MPETKLCFTFYCRKNSQRMMATPMDGYCRPPSNQSLGCMTTPSSQKGSISWIDMESESESESRSAVWDDGTRAPPSLGFVVAAIIIPCQNAVCVLGESIYDPIISQRILGFFMKASPAMYVFGSRVVERERERVALVGQAALKDGVESCVHL
ncbi:hypothetical protein MUK42_19230 [Musa troglodytarum]|uniref:Uncharacterized protein n=1 Tax=Musa troglodytarum TaxID=320322 RepID=A0A9E7EUZ2_9LILI|nr:hypothetical protein MUK42_19230 [Musa troglodytarum]